MKKDPLVTAIERLADLAGQSFADTKRWVMWEANQAHVRPLTFCRKRLHELRTWSPMKLLNNAKAKGRLKHISHDEAYLRTKAVSRAARRGIPLAEAYTRLLKKEALENA